MPHDPVLGRAAWKSVFVVTGLFVVPLWLPTSLALGENENGERDEN